MPNADINGLYLGLYLRASGTAYETYVMNFASDYRLNAVPTSIVYFVDATNVTITVAGTTFVAGGGTEKTFAHGKDESNFSNFYLINSYDEYNTLSANFGSFTDSIQVGAVPEPSTYAAICGLVVLGLAARRKRAA